MSKVWGRRYSKKKAKEIGYFMDVINILYVILCHGMNQSMRNALNAKNSYLRKTQRILRFTVLKKGATIKGLIMVNNINVIGAGLSGCEAAWQISRMGIKVNLFDMKPQKLSPAHKSPYLCELVCSNSFKSIDISNASGLLKEEVGKFDSLILNCANKCKVPAGGALAVDRDEFSKLVTKNIQNNKLINFEPREITKLKNDDINIIATGPLTSKAFESYISDICGGSLSFFDAAAPIVTSESIDMKHTFLGSRYDKGENDSYLNCPMDENEYDLFYNELISAQIAHINDFDVLGPKVYQGCMPIEVMAKKGKDSIRYGPLKPVGFIDPKTGKRPFAVAQLRKENAQGSLYNMVGFQTNLKFNEQKRVFGLISALKNMEIVRYGVMHRNTFIDSPRILNSDYSMRNNNNVFFAGQITGTEGYMESVSSGIIAGINAARRFKNLKSIIFPRESLMGALASYISDGSIKDFQPMGANFGIIPPLKYIIKNKKLKKTEMAKRSIELLEGMISCEDNS